MRHWIVEQDADLAQLREAWHALSATQSRALLPLSWEWFSAWWQSFGGQESLVANPRPCIHVFADERGPRAIVPLFRLDCRFRGIPVHGLATMANGHSPLWDAVLHGGITPGEINEIGRTLLATPGIDILFFRQIAADSLLLAWLWDHVGEFGRTGLHETVRMPVVHAHGRWEDYLDSRSRKYRRNVRKKVREFLQEPGAAIECIPLRSGRDPVLEEVVSVSRRSWKTDVRNDLVTNRAGRDFLRRMIDLFGPRGDAVVWLARFDGIAIAYELHLRGGGVTYPIRADMDEAWRALAPGSVLEYHALEAAFADPGIEIYDTCAASYWYLTNLTDEARLIHDVEFFPRRLKSVALYYLEYFLIVRLRPLRDFFRGLGRA